MNSLNQVEASEFRIPPIFEMFGINIFYIDML